MMITGGKLLLAGTCLAAAGCVSGSQNVQIRTIDPSAKVRYGGSELDQARGLLALGNVGLALEKFRKIQREQPPSADTFAGIAACYAAMSRYDLARANYEFALAYAPDDPKLLNALASSLDRLGQTAQAIQVRAEAARLASLAPSQPTVQQAAIAPLGVPRASSITVKLPAVNVAAAPEPDIVAIARPRLTDARVSLASRRAGSLKQPALVANATVSVATPAPAEAATPIAPPQLAWATIDLPQALPAARMKLALRADADFTVSETPALAPEPPVAIAPPKFARAPVDLPPVRPAAIKATALDAPVQISLPLATETTPPARPVPVRKPVAPEAIRVADALPAESRVSTGPRLERRSSGEVSLITTPRPVQLAQFQPRVTEPKTLMRAALVSAERRPAQSAARPMLATALRWVPLRFASAPQNVVLLNAARKEGLAARTRTALIDRGWRKIAIGDARKVRQRSLVLYSPARGKAAKRIAAHLGCRAVKFAGIKNVIVLLGRDASSKRSA